jgi:hypothetical protein
MLGCQVEKAAYVPRVRGAGFNTNQPIQHEMRIDSSNGENPLCGDLPAKPHSSLFVVGRCLPLVSKDMNRCSKSETG